MLTPADEWPIHQTAEPIAFSGTDRNFYDRYFFHGRSRDGARALGVALGVYPHLDLIDAAVSVLDGKEQWSLFASRRLHHDRMAVHVGPIALEIEEPLRRLAVTLGAAEGFEGRLVFEADHPPVLEPRFTRRLGGRTLMDATRMTQNGRWSGRLAFAGHEAELEGWIATRDRSWGVRPIGAPDAQPLPGLVPQFFWLWAPTSFPDFHLFAHTNDDAEGRTWNRAAVLVERGSGREIRLEAVRFQPEWQAGSRRLKALAMEALWPDGRRIRADWSPGPLFYMHQLGYGHPSRGHGLFQGESHVGSERFETAGVDPGLPAHAHVQALATATLTLADGAPQTGTGLVEQLVIGPHAPSGLRGLYDPA